nr:zinc finger, CCHC-type [Tanacetum cinerariifolium]
MTFWFSKKQLALAISTTEAEYLRAEKACQQALWMKQALIDYDIRLDDVPIVCGDGGDDATMERIRKRAKMLNLPKNYGKPIEAKYMAEDASGSHLRIEESLKVQDNDKPKGNNVVGPSVVNMVKHNNSFRYNDNKGKSKHHDNTMVDPNNKAKPTCWKCDKNGHIKRDCKGVNVGNKANGIECIFVGYAEHFKAFRLYVIEPNNSVLINFVIESRDEIFDENRFSSGPRSSLRIPNGTEDIGGSVVLEEVTKEVVQQLEPELRKSKRNKTPKNFWPEFQLYLVKGTQDEYHKNADCYGINSQSGYSLDGCEDIFLECKSDESGKGVIICLYLDDMLIFGTDQVQADLTKECLSSRFSMKDIGEADVIHEFEFVALANAGKEVEWFKNLILEIPLWLKPIAHISIYYDSVATLAKAYSQMYNGKSGHLGVRHSMICKLVMNGVVFIEFVRS